MSDVARHAGVSRATASYVLNRTPGARIPEQTRARVLAAAEELRYVPHVSARSLRRGRSDLVVGHVDGLAGLRNGTALTGLVDIAHATRKAGYTFLFHGDPTITGLSAARAWLALRPAAVVAALDRYTEESVAMLREAGTLPIALSHTPSPLTTTVVLDDGEVGRVAARRLLERGRRRIAVLTSHEDPAERRRTGNRVEAAEATVRAAGAEVTTVATPPGALGAEAVVRGWRTAGTLPDGIVGGTATLAAAVLGALGDAGVRVPEDTAVVAADDEPWCALLRPRLTTVAAEPGGKHGTRASDAVLAALTGHWDAELAVQRFPARVLPRDSG